MRIVMIQIMMVLLVLAMVQGQGCLKASGQGVKWWVVLKVPPKLGVIAYAYYDSTMNSAAFSYYPFKIDEGSTPLTKTIQQINDLNLQHVAWNDQKPSGQTSSQFAHSKGFISYSPTTSKGFFLSHSIPKYPAFVNNKIVPTIAPSQNVYGQNLACFSLSLKQLQSLADNLLISWPFVYQSVVNNSVNTQSLYRLSRSNFPKVDTLFNKHDLVSVAGYTIKVINKNDKVNGSIFEDGLTQYLKSSPLIAQTWGRPLDKAWCSPSYQVLNVLRINLKGVRWSETDDHSKWVLVGNKLVCFGDMNRMSSQWKRGGSFYCLSEVGLVQAMLSIIQSHDSC